MPYDTELAVIYDTEDKERQIAEQKAKILQQRLWGIAAVFTLFILFFLVYDWYRRRVRKRLTTAHELLETAHTELKTAYDQLEETTAAKERIESELRIARDIQLSMVPTDFPDRSDIDVYGSMTMAKAVGGDLYDIFVSNDQLYFCIGDVSGKGIPAALLMMETKSLFRAYAKGESMPDRIVSAMNRDLSENNDDCLFVTFFCSILDLSSGLLRYCNAGHDFVGDTEQSDDLTMLAVRLR